MAAQFARAPHQGRFTSDQHAPNAALLIDFDNVTLGIRDDLSKELKNLLDSDIIKGKVAVQRAYADWRRYPQYIVQLAESSVDLIFAPAYGSSKKNATDIRLAIDALELVFTRPEIGTFILLSGDSDFSSLVLKLKEYGKYVIGVGIRESASDLLVQNCDEYYSYSALSGLTRKSEEDGRGIGDPWVLVEEAVRRMAERKDVMRSDRLKQVMVELDPNFNEKEIGYSKFSKFLSDASSRGCLHLKKLDNGQWEVQPANGRSAAGSASDAAESEPRRSRDQARRSRGGRGRSAAEREEPVEVGVEPVDAAAPAEAEPVDTGRAGSDPLRAAYALLRRAVEQVLADGSAVARDSDVKRQMLALEPGWDESSVGFSRFSRFLRQAHDAEVIDLRKAGDGVYEVTLAGASQPPKGVEQPSSRSSRGGSSRGRRTASEAAPAAEPRPAVTAASRAEPARPEGPRTEGPKAEPAAESPRAEAVHPADEVERAGAARDAAARPAEVTIAATPAAARSVPRGIGFRRGTRGRAAGVGPPPVLPGQAVPAGMGWSRAASTAGGAPAIEPAAEGSNGRSAASAERERGGRARSGRAEPASSSVAAQLGLPTDADAVRSYLANRYKGVGRKTADVLIETFGAAGVFDALQTDEARVRAVLGERRAGTVLAAWRSDYAQRTSVSGSSAEQPAEAKQPARGANSSRSRRKPEAESPASMADATAAPAAQARGPEESTPASNAAGADATPDGDEAPQRSRSRRGRRGGRKKKSQVAAGGSE
ncbi:MAG TPA: NYN domain-containing protein [Longimicrobiales bacterium]